MSDNWFLYILRCADNTLYTGITTDVAHRFETHQKGKGAKYTKGRGPLILCYQEYCGSHTDALRRELAVKALTKAEKESMIAQSLQDTRNEEL